MYIHRQARRWSHVLAFGRPCLSPLAALIVALTISLPLASSVRAQDAATSTVPAATPSAPAAATTAQQAPAAAAAVPPPAAAAAPGAATPPQGVMPEAATPGPQPAPPGAATPAVAAPATPPMAAPAGEPAIGGDMKPENLSLERMFNEADRVVQAVMIGLAFASLVTWTVFLAKTLELHRARIEVRRALRVLADAPTLAQAHQQLRDDDENPVAPMMASVAQEIRLSEGVGGDGLKERVTLQLERLEMANSRKISRGTGVLATIGSTAVFVGLFGTVWGIMNSFIGISNAHTTNLAVVAPGIAQALLATAMGLVAAIPAVVIYNVLTRQTSHYRALLGDASAQIIRLVSRDLDRAKLPLAQAAE
jgi:biopolymer transport protein ExbB